MTGQNPTPDWSAWLPTSLYDALMRIERRIGEIAGRQDAEARETRRHLDRQDHMLDQIDGRVMDLERRPIVQFMDPPTVNRHWVVLALIDLRSFLSAVATPREWIIGGLIVLAATKGVLAPDDIRRFLSAVIGLPLT